MVVLQDIVSSINREERAKINDNWRRIIEAFNKLQRQINVITGDVEIEKTIEEIVAATENANVAIATVMPLIEEVEIKIGQLGLNIATSSELIQSLNTIKDDMLTLESDIRINEQDRIDAELSRVNAEDGRIFSEDERITNEQARIDAEVNRNNAELARDEAEQERISNELIRQSALEDMQDIIEEFDVKGEYNSSTTYEKFNVVRYGRDSYIALATVVAVTPSDDGVNWRQIAMGGIDGTGAVSSVNGILPDASGNVTIEASGVEVVDSLQSVATDKALSAGKGKAVNDDLQSYKQSNDEALESTNQNITALEEDLNAYKTSNDESVAELHEEMLTHESESNTSAHTIDNIVGLRDELNTTASETTLGRVMVDGETIVANGEGVLTVIGGGSDIRVADVSALSSTYVEAINVATVTWVNPTNSEFNNVDVYASNIDIGGWDKEACDEHPSVSNVYNGDLEVVSIPVEKEKVYYIKVFASHNVFGTLTTSHGISIQQSTEDKTPPAMISDFKAIAENGSVELTWVNPTDSDFSTVLILMAQAEQPAESSQSVYQGKDTSVTVPNLTNGVEYFFRAFTYDLKGNENSSLEGAVVSAIPVEGIPLNTLPVGTLVKDIHTTYYGEPIVWKIADKNHAGYPANSITLISNKIITLKSFDAKEPTNTNTNRVSYGNNRYAVSNIRQWLNSNENSWYSPQHQYDAPPTSDNVDYNSYDTEEGFLTNFSQGFKNALLNTENVTAKTTADNSGSEVVKDKVFLLSLAEFGLNSASTIVEGTVLPIFTNDASRIVYPTQQAVDNSTYTNESFNSDAPWSYWVRSCVSNANGINSVAVTGGSAARNPQQGALGLVPALNLMDSVTVSPTPDSDGVYTLLTADIPSPLTPQVDNFKASTGNQQTTISWTISDDINLQDYVFTYKEDSAPTNIDDGIRITVAKGLNSHTITGLTNDVEYFIRAFPRNTEGQVQTEYKVVSVTPRDAVIYGVDIDETDSNPETSVTYTEMSVGFTPATNLTMRAFNYGSWENKFPYNQLKPFAISHDLTEYIELNPNNFRQKLDGTAIDTSINGNYNVMIRFPKVYWKFEKVGDIVSIKISDNKVDETYRAWAHEYGTEEYEYIYISAYNIGTVTLNNVNYAKSQTGSAGNSINLNTVRTLVKANNTTGTDVFEITNYYQYQMLQVLYTIMFKNLDSQTALGRGIVSANVMSTRGGTSEEDMYFGNPASSSQNIKIFGIENLWGNVLKWVEGLKIGDTTSTIQVKNNDYANSADWTTLNGAVSGTQGYITKVLGGEFGFLPSTTSGSSSTYYCDNFNYAKNCYAVFGGGFGINTLGGIYNVNINAVNSGTNSALFTHYKNQ